MVEKATRNFNRYCYFASLLQSREESVRSCSVIEFRLPNVDYGFYMDSFNRVFSVVLIYAEKISRFDEEKDSGYFDKY